MLDFGAWTSAMAGKIEDKSTVMRKTSSAKLTPLQIRMLFASMVVPDPKTRGDVDTWLMMFCTHIVRATGDATHIVLGLNALIPSEYQSWCLVVSDSEAISWLNHLKQNINAGRIPCIQK